MKNKGFSNVQHLELIAQRQAILLLDAAHSKLLQCAVLSQTHGPDVAGLGAGGVEGAAGVVAGAAAASGADGAAASGGGIFTCFQSCPSSTMRAMRVPSGTLRLPSSIWKWGRGQQPDSQCCLFFLIQDPPDQGDINIFPHLKGKY